MSATSYTKQLRLAVIIGSVRNGRFGPVVARWAVDQATEHGGFTVDVVDLAETELPLRMPAFGTAPFPEAASALATLSPKLDAADAFVVLTPEYNHSYPAALKNAIDWHHKQWHAKPVAFVSYGGISGGLRAVEHLRVVFAEVHAMTIRDTVSFHTAWTRFDEQGQPVDAESCNGAMKTMLDQLLWWGVALSDAKSVRPYTA
jgi:NAD(P)H-dependent FMN reductase